MKFTILAVAAALMLPTPINAAPKKADAKPKVTQTRKPLPEFEFRGHRSGEDISVAFSDQSKCWNNVKKLRTECPDQNIHNDARKAYLGDLPIISLDYYFYEGKLYQITVAYKAEHYPEIKGMAVGKYGPPKLRGADISPLVKLDVWEFKQGELTLFSSYDVGTFTFEDADIAKKRETAIASKQADDAKKAF